MTKMSSVMAVLGLLVVAGGKVRVLVVGRELEIAIV